jgi:hypothetical protein
MYLINIGDNRITKLESKTFSELGFKERENLQEWIANEPTALGEELLIIQKEFDGFSDTRERLDLLALDKEGNVVVIENKLDDSGKDVTWQALKYASYCSSLSKEDIRKIYQEYLSKEGLSGTAEERLSEFFNNADYEELVINRGLSQRIVLVAANFRKEVTSTVLWLSNYNVKIQCFKVKPFKLGEELFLDVEQIIPMKDTEDYVIKMAEKAMGDKEAETKQRTNDVLKTEFWNRLLPEINKKSSLFQNVHAANVAYISAGSGIGGVGYYFVGARSYARVEMYMDNGNKSENEFIFDYLFNNFKEAIEERFGAELVWERLDGKNACRIKFQESYNFYNKDEWDVLISFLVDSMVRFEKAFKEYMPAVNAELKKRRSEIGG